MLAEHGTKKRLAVVVSHPTQHFAPLYARIAESEEVELKVFFIAENGVKLYRDNEFGIDLKWDVSLTQGYQHEFVEPGKIIQRFTFLSVDSRRLISSIEKFKPDLIWVHGYAQRANWRVILKRPNAAAIIYSSDSNLQDPRSIHRQFLKSAAVRYFFRCCDHFLSISSANRQYLVHYGVPDSAIINTVFPIDMDRLQQQRDALKANNDFELRQELNIPVDAPIALFAGKLVAHKRPQDLIGALSQSGLQGCYAVFVGSGDMKDELSRLATRLKVSERCRFIGFVNQNEMAMYLSLATLFVFTSEKEPYGAMAAEVLPFALPMVVAEGIGAIGASILENENALLFPVGDERALGRAILKLIEDPQLYKRFSEASLQLSAAHDKSHMARDIIGLCCSSHTT